jgi:hypothetical protein
MVWMSGILLAYVLESGGFRTLDRWTATADLVGSSWMANQQLSTVHRKRLISTVGSWFSTVAAESWSASMRAALPL